MRTGSTRAKTPVFVNAFVDPSERDRACTKVFWSHRLVFAGDFSLTFSSENRFLPFVCYPDYF